MIRNKKNLILRLDLHDEFLGYLTTNSDVKYSRINGILSWTMNRWG